MLSSLYKRVGLPAIQHVLDHGTRTVCTDTLDTKILNVKYNVYIW
jgi:hypothetical protein